MLVVMVALAMVGDDWKFNDVRGFGGGDSDGVEEDGSDGDGNTSLDSDGGGDQSLNSDSSDDGGALPIHVTLPGRHTTSLTWKERDDQLAATLTTKAAAANNNNNNP
ncbi:hypothetical protein E2C01_082222 [Portunus trituberculatus]|uniref:Uncharacterized protein n=1 Tax=Portunus trituberculatus TaxID=210409 RepID=A0A5B7IPC1_PORTR|nr:hypothetical protein [Portunus trituberculatus]